MTEVRKGYPSDVSDEWAPCGPYFALVRARPVGGPKKINAALSEKTSGGGWSKRGRPRHEDRPFVEAMLWIARTGCPWRDLPAEFPQWQSVYTRWRRWVQRRIWAR
eukprot:gene14728-19485_t